MKAKTVVLLFVALGLVAGCGDMTVKDTGARSLPAVQKAAQLAQSLGAELLLYHAISEPIYIDALTTAMLRLADAPDTRHALGAAARRRALADFPMPVLTSALLDFYAKMLN